MEGRHPAPRELLEQLPIIYEPMPHTVRALIAVAIWWSAVLPAGVYAQDRVENESAGIALDRPSGWQTATLAQVQNNRERTRLSDPELQAGLRTRSALPLIVFTKYAEPH